MRRNGCRKGCFWRVRFVVSEEDKRATTNVQNGLVFFFLLFFGLFSSL